jgi:predicted small secreted protein
VPRHGNFVVVDFSKEISMRYLVALFALMGVVSLSACNTVEGLGQDIQKGGEAIEKAAK